MAWQIIAEQRGQSWFIFEVSARPFDNKDKPCDLFLSGLSLINQSVRRLALLPLQMAAVNPNTPAGIPPPGVIPNFQAYSLAGSLYATCATVTGLMVLLVISRLYSRIRYTKQLASDDCKLSGNLRLSRGLMAIRYVHSCLSGVHQVSCQDWMS